MKIHRIFRTQSENMKVSSDLPVKEFTEDPFAGYGTPVVWIPVESSFISEVSYHEGLGFMEVRLKDGRKLTFKDISKELYDAFMSAPKKGEFFNKYLRRRRAQGSNWYFKAVFARNDLSTVTEDQWDEISTRLVGGGYDIRGPEDAKRIYTEHFRGKPTGFHKQVFDAVVNGKEYIVETSPKVVENVFSKAIKYFGTTENLEEAGYILPDGTLLDLSGRNQGSGGGARYLDHREVSQFIRGKYDQGDNTTPMLKFVQMGAIRHFPEQPGVDIRREPTGVQMGIIRKDVSYSGHGYNVEINDPRRGKFYKEYDPAPQLDSRVVSDILSFYGRQVM